MRELYKNTKILKFNANIMKIINIFRIPYGNQSNHENLGIPLGNYENHENLKTTRES